ncbi:phospholipase D family protein [Thermodesulfovibrio yellowstonii]|uniref:NgoFVII family restriction endonuclease n=1 Tax=Thermodesulfovibrio yellowstonii TaxID=28262 RepID=A0A9W6LJN1_9BACT|nr:phospholipase D family protein [Thermodesulfovibrio islandicus]GLI52323.1 NgoFVII family restriction endonuclease [Thermodesulfovibrio islandicus]
MDLFTKKVSYLHILYNDKPFKEKSLSLFDIENHSFTDLRVVTYVSSPDFFFDKVKKFKKVIAILGEEESAREFYAIDPTSEEKFIHSAEADPEVLEALTTGKIELRYMKAGERIHSKIYILSDDDGNLRVMVGSANFTNSAFSNSRQYEELIVYDSSYNPLFCKTYLNRFEEIYQNSVDFLSEKTRKKLQSLILKTENILIFTPDDRTESIIERVQRQIHSGGDAESLVVEVMDERERIDKKIMEIERIEKIIEHVTKKTKNGYSFEPKQKLITLKDKLREIVSFSHKRTQEFIDKRNFLYLNPANWEFYVKENEQAVSYTVSLTKEELQSNLLKLVNFVNSYWEFAVYKDREVLKRVFEAILFAFTSPFIYLIRKHVKKHKGDEKLAEIPIVLILGGLANTGKTKLLLFINKLLGNNFEVFNYKDIYTKTQRILYDIFSSNNIFPILVDEIYDNFFRGEGERLIKTLTNTITDPHPCLIGTSNVGFSAESQVIRRIYYLHFGSPFSEDKKAKEKAEKYFEEKVDGIDDSLFRYFLKEFAKKMTDEEFFKIEDPLFLSRQIFIKMFKQAELEIPDFISESPCGDYYKIGSQEWQAFYLTRKKDFKEMKDGGEKFFVVDLKSIYEPKDAEALKNKLPPSVVKSSGTPLILHKDRFLHFIGQKEGFLKKILG